MGLNLRRTKHIKKVTIDKTKYFTIYNGGARVITDRLELYVSEYGALKLHYNILSEHHSLYQFVDHQASVVRHYNIYDETVYSLCKVKDRNVWFFISKSDVKDWKYKDKHREKDE